MNWRDIIYLRFGDEGTLELTVGPLFWAGAAAMLISIFVWSGGFRRLKSLFYVGKVSINFAGHHVELHPNDEVIQIAHCAWVELSTRKAGLPFDSENDVIVEVYDSWYELFGEMRGLASACKVRRMVDDEDTQKVIDLIVDVLNDGLRPHLTKWQARFRRWYAAALLDDTNAGRTPQEIQRTYPQYDELIAELEAVNQDLMQYRDGLRRAARRDT